MWLQRTRTRKEVTPCIPTPGQTCQCVINTETDTAGCNICPAPAVHQLRLTSNLADIQVCPKHVSRRCEIQLVSPYVVFS
jgi:hypothetical protein